MGRVVPSQCLRCSSMVGPALRVSLGTRVETPSTYKRLPTFAVEPFPPSGSVGKFKRGAMNLALQLLREVQKGRERAISDMSRGSVEYNNVVRALVEAKERISVLEAEVARVQGSADQLADTRFWAGFIRGTCSFVMANLGIHLSTLFEYEDATIPEAVRTSLQPIIASIPLPPPAADYGVLIPPQGFLGVSANSAVAGGDHHHLQGGDFSFDAPVQGVGRALESGDQIDPGRQDDAEI